jgi:N-acetylmuramoyl-L-alanine amidase
MQVRTRYIANLLLVAIASLAWQYPSVAQYLHYGKSRYPRVLSVSQDTSGKYIVLNLQGKSCLNAPAIHYLACGDGRTIMVADFANLQFAQEPKVFKPANAKIDSVRLGQFQESPPIFRISISTYDPAILKKLDLCCQSKSLLIKFPPEPKAARAPEPAVPNTSKPEPPKPQRRRFAFQSAPRLPGAKTESANQAEKPLVAAAPPFPAGGLYLELGPDPVRAAEPGNSKPVYPGDFGPKPRPKPALLPEEPALRQEGAKVRGLPPVAPERTAMRSESSMPAVAPSLAKSGNTVASRQESSQTSGSGFAGRLRRLFRKHASFDSEQASLDPTPSEPGPSRAAEAEAASVKDNSNAASGDRTHLYPELSYSGTNPLKVRLKFEAKPRYRIFRLDDPPRYVVDLEDFHSEINQLPEPETNPWLKSVRIGNPEERLTRIVLDLAQARVHVKEELDEREPILTLTLAAETGEAGSVRGHEIVLDAGHGGSDPGAQRGDIQEKEITLAITQKIKRYLEEKGVKVIMTRRDDSYVSLEDRTKITNQAHPDAFVSVHINSLESDRDIRGIETYYQTEQSRALADKVHAKLVECLQVPDRSVRKARFYVVNHTDRPAILAEVGFISNKDERDKLISSDYQSKIAESLGQGVILYLGNSSEPANAVVSAAQANDWTHRVSPGRKPKPALASNEQDAVKQ